MECTGFCYHVICTVQNILDFNNYMGIYPPYSYGNTLLYKEHFLPLKYVAIEIEIKL